MYFLSNAFRGFKSTLSFLGLLSSGGVIGYGGYTVAGGTGLGWVAVAMGILCMIPSLFGVFESTKLLNDIQKEIGNLKTQITAFEEENVKFQTQNEQLKENVYSLEEAKNRIIKENDKLSVLADRQEEQTRNLDAIRREYEDEVKKFKKEAEKYASHNNELSIENSTLKESISRIEKLKEDLKVQNGAYQQSLSRMKAHVETMEQLKAEYLKENEKLNKSLVEQKEQLTVLTGQTQEQQTQILQLKDALDKSEQQALALKALVLQLKELYRNLVLAGDAFKSFEETIGGDVSKLDDTTHTLEKTVENMTKMMDRLNTKLLEGDFAKLDKNGDGTITQDEFNEYFGGNEEDNTATQVTEEATPTEITKTVTNQNGETIVEFNE